MLQIVNWLFYAEQRAFFYFLANFPKFGLKT